MEKQRTWDNIPGWFWPESEETLLKIFDEHHISRVLEIGSFKGKSSVFFASHVLETICVDPFLAWQDGIERGAVQQEEDFYAEFLKNVEDASHIQRIGALRTIRKTSQQAWVKNPNLMADLIYLDAEHTYEQVKLDIAMWLPRAKKIICGDDYIGPYHGVAQAVDEMLPDRIINDHFWYKII